MHAVTLRDLGFARRVIGIEGRRLVVVGQRRQRGGETAAQVSVEIGIELAGIDAEMPQQGRFLVAARAVFGEDVANDAEIPARLDEFQHQRSLVIRMYDLLGIAGTHETVIQAADRQ